MSAGDSFAAAEQSDKKLHTTFTYARTQFLSTQMLFMFVNSLIICAEDAFIDCINLCCFGIRYEIKFKNQSDSTELKRKASAAASESLRLIM